MDLTTLNTSDRRSVLWFLKRESWRLATFSDDWQHQNNPNLTKEAMAAAGFFYTGNGDQVQCPFCLIIIGT